MCTLRAFMRTEVEPIINDYWTRARFPFQILDGFRQLGIAGLPTRGTAAPAAAALDGMVFMEIARTDPSIATFHGVHSGLAMGRSTCADPTSNAIAGYLAWPASNRSARSG